MLPQLPRHSQHDVQRGMLIRSPLRVSYDQAFLLDAFLSVTQVSDQRGAHFEYVGGDA